MSCFHPVPAVYTGAEVFMGRTDAAIDGREIELPCGRCVGCLVDRTRQWAVRLVTESQMHEDNCFVTLTYDDEHLPEYGYLDVKDFQLFIKRLRKKFSVLIPQGPRRRGIRRKRIYPRFKYFHAGEYGGRLGRPHYHVLFFGFDFLDKKAWRTSDTGYQVYRSEVLESLWGNGFCEIGSVTPQSAAYVARYVVKKIFGDGAKDHYFDHVSQDGEMMMKPPEYVTMSRRPGISSSWLEKYWKDVYAADKDYVVLDGQKFKTPRYFDNFLQDMDSDRLDFIKKQRVDRAVERRADSTPERLASRERVKQAQLSQLKRKLKS